MKDSGDFRLDDETIQEMVDKFWEPHAKEAKLEAAKKKSQSLKSEKGKIYWSLPLWGDGKQGKTCHEISTQTRIEDTNRVSSHLQVLKKDGCVRDRKDYWKRTRLLPS